MHRNLEASGSFHALANPGQPIRRLHGVDADHKISEGFGVNFSVD
jgi:hypothetical protein